MTIRPVVLAVDDDARVLDAYQAILESRCEVLTAPDGRTALEILQARTVDVVLLDLLMPGLSGLAVLKALKRLQIETNVVVVSGMNDTASAFEALRLGATDYLSKPFDVGHLHHVIARLTERAAPGEHAPATRSSALPHAVVVTDDAALRAALAVALRTRGRVDAVADMSAALGVLVRTRPDVVVASDQALVDELRAAGCAVPMVVVEAGRRDFAAPLRAVVDALGTHHSDVRPFTGPVARAVAHAAAHAGRISAETIAISIGMSPGSLARMFADEMEMTITEYVTHVRLEATRPRLAKMLRRHAFSVAASYRAR